MKSHTPLLHLIILGTVGVLLTAFPVQARQSFMDNYNVAHVTMNEGLPHNFIDDIYKDSEGFLWIAMEGGGLTRYDGYRFVDFTFDSAYRPLKSNFVRKITEDKFHRLWVASEGGIDIIDLRTMQSLTLLDTHPQTSALSLSPASLVETDAAGCIWMHCDNSIYRIGFDPEGGIASVHTRRVVPRYRNQITFEDVENNGTIWIALDGVLHKAEAGINGDILVSPLADCLVFAPHIDVTDFAVKENEVWISTNNGLYRYNPSRAIVRRYEHDPQDPHSLTQNFLTCLAVTKDKQLMVGSLKGINIYNPTEDRFERIDDQSTEPSHLNNNFINCILTDERHIWIGTENGGLNQLSHKRLSMHTYHHDRDNPASLSRYPVNAIYEDSDRVLWVGTVEGGLNRKEPDSNLFTHYTHEAGILSHNSVSAITACPDNQLWVGTWGGGITVLDRLRPSRRLKVIPGNAVSSALDFIGVLAYDSINHGVWIGANQGVFFYDLQREEVQTPLPGQDIRGCIGSLIDNDGQLWMGSLDGVFVIDLRSRIQSATGKQFAYRHLKYKLDAPQSGVVEKITCLHQSKDGTIWLGSNGYGFYKRVKDDDGQERFIAYTTRQGLVNNSIRSILEDQKGDLWIATYNGLSRYILSEERFVNYTRQDGLHDPQFYWNAACPSAEGGLYFGNTSGLVAIDGDLTPGHSPAHPVRFTRLIIDNEEMQPGSEQLPQDMASTRHIRIHEGKKSFSVEFSSLGYGNTSYTYRLLGFDKRWKSVPRDMNFVSYTNLSPGSYTLQVMPSLCPADGDEALATLDIDIIPYFYKTPWFIALLIFAACFGIWQAYQARIRSFKRQKAILSEKVELRTREINQQKLLLEKQTDELSQQNEQLKQQNQRINHQKSQLAQMAHNIRELTLDKMAFFTNITHEFRTPLTLIIGPIERALKLSSNPKVIEQLNFVERNSKYLLSLINQLMDFRKVESGKMDIHIRKNDFRRFANELLTPFTAFFAQERNIDIQLRLRMPEAEIYYDEEAMHKVLTNLLSNAIKFTPDGGRVTLYAALFPPTDSAQPPQLYLCVNDTGNGIAEEDINKVFERFYQSKDQNSYPIHGQASSGIGLYLCKTIVQMLGGTIYARNNRRGGCSIRILLPLTETGEEMRPAPQPQTSLPEEQPFAEAENTDLSILVVEDSPDMRSYIRSILRDRFKVLEASDGLEALDILNAGKRVDFIISDLMMPNMDGIEFANRVKGNLVTAHIPLLMLTAKTSQESRIESFRTGADDYLLKPFNEELLLARIENILENQRRHQRRFAILNQEEPRTGKLSDNQFIQRVMDILQANVHNPQFGSSAFCEAVGASKTVLNKRMQKLVGQSIGQFIRTYRLNFAYNLLSKADGSQRVNVADVALRAGFNDPKYFTRCFTKEFNLTPSELLNRKRD